MKKDFPPLNIEIPETVKREAGRLAEERAVKHLENFCKQRGRPKPPPTL
jgi:hypothetical protein